ncbi:MAG: hypothetical protein Q4D41_08290 [Prevotellaceae bacterium]|nr:hypothetical protein [Prevotellaceae bacterium]
MMKIFTLMLAAFLMTSMTAHSQWTDDYGSNTQITPTGLGYYESEMKTNNDGITYVFFIVPSGETLSMRLQILDKDGNKILSRGGKTISQEANKTWTVMNQYLMVDNEGNAIIAVPDFRTAPEEMLSTYTIYKYSPDGTQLWSGVTLNGGIGYDAAAGLTMCLSDDGGYVFAYEYTDASAQKDFVRVEKLDKDGTSVWNKVIAEDGYFNVPYPYIFNAGDGNIMVLYVYGGGSEIKSHVMNSDGETLYSENNTVYSEGLASSKVWEVMHINPGPDNGALITCVNSSYNGVFSYIKKDGTPAFVSGTKGVTLNDSYASGEPAAVYCSKDNSFICSYKPFDYDNSSYQGLYLKKISITGESLWTTSIPVEEMKDDYKYSYCSIRNLTEDNVALFYQKYDNTTAVVNSFVVTYDNEGNKVGDALQFSTTSTTKENLRSSELIDGSYFITMWDEKRNGSNYTLYMQKVPVDAAAGIKSVDVNTEKNIIDTEYYTISGERLTGPMKGVNIVRCVYDDNTIVTRKVVIK